MASRYNLRGPSGGDGKSKRKRESLDNKPGDNNMLKVRGYLKVLIDDLVEDEIEAQLETIFNTVDDHINCAFNDKLKETAQKFSKMSVGYIKSSIMSACHDMIHDHLDTFDLSLSTEQYKMLISEVIQKDFGGKLQGKKPEISAKNSTRIKIHKTTTKPQSSSPAVSQPQKKPVYPKKYNEETLKDHTNAVVNQIVALETTKENKEIIYKQFLSGITPSGKSRRTAKEQDWLDAALAMPYQHQIKYPIKAKDTNSRVHSFLLNMQKKLDKTVHGMKQAKEEIILEVMKRVTNPNSQGKILVLEGPPGIGKTYLSRSVSECMGIPFESISLGGCRDASVLNGHNYCYVGSHPGAIARALKAMKCCNGVMYLDEIDKIGGTEQSREVSASFLSILDESQNSAFSDNYLLDLKLDLSKLFFIGSVNNADLIDPILRNRMKIIKLPVPTLEDKLAIVKQHFIPMYLEQYSIPKTELVFTDDIIKYIINKTKKEPGVREIKRAIEHVVSRFNLLRKTHVRRRKKRKVDNESTNTTKREELEFSFSIPNFKTPLMLTNNIVNKFMKTLASNNINPSVKRLYM